MIAGSRRFPSPFLLQNHHQMAQSHSRLVSERYPAPGQDEVADAIYARRGGTRGLCSLDANLLNAPVIALGYNSLLDAIRNKGKLAGVIREAMVYFFKNLSVYVYSIMIRYFVSQR